MVNEHRSLNNTKNHLVYEKELLDQFKLKYPRKPGEKAFFDNSKPLYVQIYYFVKRRRSRDVDNILKYMIDSFNKYLYRSDMRIGYSLSQAVEIRNNQITPISFSKFDKETSAVLYDFLTSDDREWISCTYFECGVMTDKFYHIDLENIWK